MGHSGNYKPLPATFEFLLAIAFPVDCQYDSTPSPCCVPVNTRKSIKAISVSQPPNLPASDPLTSSPVQRLDRQLIELLGKRRALVEAHDGGPVVRMATANRKIEELLGNLASQREWPAGLAVEDARQWLRHAASLCIDATSEARVAYLGPKFSYSYLATVQFFGEAAPLAPVQSIESVFEAVVGGDCRAGVVPIENSTDGRIVDTLGMFVKHNVSVCGEVLLPIHHNLLARTAREQITQVCSKPQALSQCRRWLARHLPQAKWVEVASTTEAARLAGETPGVAAVASAEAGWQYGLDVVDANIEDNQHNVTRFAILGDAAPAATGRDKTTMLFQLNHQPGALADAMAIFKDNRLNLTWTESFPNPGEKAEYFFFVECEGHRSEPAVGRSIDRLNALAKRLDVLGSYPMGKLPAAA